MLFTLRLYMKKRIHTTDQYNLCPKESYCNWLKHYLVQGHHEYYVRKNLVNITGSNLHFCVYYEVGQKRIKIEVQNLF